MSMNRLANCKNSYQGKDKRVLCVCSAGLLRSPTAAFLLSQEPYNYNTRACGANLEYALIPLDEVLIEWADQIIFMQEEHRKAAEDRFSLAEKDVVVLGIPDNYGFKDPKLMAIMENRLKQTIKR